MRSSVLFAGLPFAAVTLAMSACSSDDTVVTTVKDGGSTTDGAPQVDAATSDAGPPCTTPDASSPRAAGTVPLSQLEHLVVIYLENHSFDNLYGDFPNVEGLSSCAANVPQIDSTGKAYSVLPQKDPNLLPPKLASALPNKPFDSTLYIAGNQVSVDLVHRYYQEQSQINGGKMDSFVSVSDALGLSYSYYPTDTLPLVQYLKTIPDQVTILDHFFHSAFGGSFLNHIWLIAAATPVFPNAPADMYSVITNGTVTTDAQLTQKSEGDFVVNTAYSVNTPIHPGTKADHLVPNQTMATIGDLLTAKNVDWAWYAGGWKNALAGKYDGAGQNADQYQWHHQPFVYFANYADDSAAGAAAKRAHLLDEDEFMSAAKAGTLKPVSFVKPVGINNEHPAYSLVTTGQLHTIELIQAVLNPINGSKTAIIITYDENGGFWDHVAPAKRDKWGPGSRVPGIVISPFAKAGVDSTSYDTSAILKLIQKRWTPNTPALSAAVDVQNDLATNAFKFAP